MIFTGEFKVGAARVAVFEKLSDARFFASCIEGVSDLQEIDATHFTAVLETKVAYIRFKFNISVEIAESEAPHRIVAKSEGNPIGMVGRLTSTSTATLTEASGETSVAYEIEVALTGKLGSMGQPVLRSKAKELERQFATNLKALFEPVISASSDITENPEKQASAQEESLGVLARLGRWLSGFLPARFKRARSCDPHKTQKNLIS